jgi:hypothetical protein
MARFPALSRGTPVGNAIIHVYLADASGNIIKEIGTEQQEAGMLIFCRMDSHRNRRLLF